MKRYIILAALFYSIFLLCCVSGNCGTPEHKIFLPLYISQEKCEAPVWNVGDYWIFQSNNKSWWSQKVVRIESDLYIIKNPNDRYTYGYDINSLNLKVYVDSEGKKVTPQTESGLSYDFPLYVGKTWSKMLQGVLTDNREQDYLYTFQVISFEHVILRTGVFKAFMISCKRNMIGSGNTATCYIWYSPEVKNIVKFKFIASYGDQRTIARDYELVTYRFTSTKKGPEISRGVFEKRQLYGQR